MKSHLKLYVPLNKESGTVLLPVMAAIVMLGFIIVANLRMLNAQQKFATDMISMTEESLVVDNTKVLLGAIVRNTLGSVEPTFEPSNFTNPFANNHKLALRLGGWEVNAATSVASSWNYAPFSNTNIPQAADAIPTSVLSFNNPYSSLFPGKTFFPVSAGLPLMFDITLRNQDMTPTLIRSIPLSIAISEISLGNFGFAAFDGYNTVGSNVKVKVNGDLDVFISGDLQTAWLSSSFADYPTLTSTGTTVVTGVWNQSTSSSAPSAFATFNFGGSMFTSNNFPDLKVDFGFDDPQSFMAKSGSVYVQRQSYYFKTPNANRVDDENNLPVGFRFSIIAAPVDGMVGAYVIDVDTIIAAGITGIQYYYITTPTANEHVIIKASSMASDNFPIIIATNGKVTLQCVAGQTKPIVVVTTNQHVRLLASNWMNLEDLNYAPQPNPTGAKSWKGRLILLGQDATTLVPTTFFNNAAAFGGRVQDWHAPSSEFVLFGSMFVSGGTLRSDFDRSDLTKVPLVININPDPDTNYNNISERFFHASNPY